VEYADSSPARQRPLAVVEGSLAKNFNKTGVRLWTAPSFYQDRKIGGRDALDLEEQSSDLCSRRQHLPCAFIDGTRWIKHGLEPRPSLDCSPGEVERDEIQTNGVVLVMTKADRGRAHKRAGLFLESLSHHARLSYRRQPHNQRLQHRCGRARLLYNISSSNSAGFLRRGLNHEAEFTQKSFD
jgi:hypothetical protein